MKKYFSLLIGFLILGAIFYVSKILMITLLSYISSLNSEVAVSIIAAAATVIVSVISIVLGKIYEVKYQVRQDIRQKKIPIYEELINFMQRTFANERLKVKPSEEELWKFFLEWQQKLMIWGSDAVLTDWIKWRRVTSKLNGGTESVFLYEQLVFKIRQDLGHKNKNLKQGDVLSLFINDIDQYLSSSSK